MGRMWLVPVLLLLGVSGAETVEACTCAPRGATCGPPGDFWRAEAVFAGRVTAIERVSEQGRGYFNQRRVRFRLLDGYRGVLPGAGRELSVFTGTVAQCGYPFKPAQDYFVYAVRQDDGRITTGVCSGTMLLERAAADVAYARQAAANAAPRGRIVGEVRHATEHSARWNPMAAFSVAIVRHGARTTAATDSRGRYTIDGLEAGSYTLDFTLAETQYSLQAGQIVELPDPRACVEADIEIRFNGRVSGRVADSAGRSVAGLTVSLTPVRGTNGARPLERRSLLTRDDGTYEIDRLAPGRVIVAVELPQGTAGRDDWPHGTAIETRATVGGGERLTLDPLVLPPAVQVVRLFGTVQSIDGAPAAGARVFLRGGGDPGHIVGAPATADSTGRFLMSVLEGETYAVFAERSIDRQPAASEFSDPVLVTAATGLLPLRLTVRRRF